MSSEHSHAHSKSESPQGSLRVVLVISILYMACEVIGGLWSGSLALIADAGHMLIDSLSVALSLVAIWVAHKPPNAKRTYGYHRAEILAALLNGAALIVVSLFIFYEAWQRIHSPEPIQGKMMLGVALGGLIVNLVSLMLLKKHSHESVNMRAVWLHVMMDAMGSVSAIAASVLVLNFGWTVADPAVSCLIALLILRGAWDLVTECVDVLLESVPKGLDIEHVRSLIASFKGVEDVHDLHVWTVKSGTYVLSAHVKVKGGEDQSKLLTEITQEIEHQFKISHSTIQLELKDFKHGEMDSTECHLIRK